MIQGANYKPTSAKYKPEYGQSKIRNYLRLKFENKN